MGTWRPASASSRSRSGSTSRGGTVADRAARRRVEGADVHRDKAADRDKATDRDKISAPASLSALDRLLHGRVRLGLVSALAVNESLTFRELKDFLGLTDG